MQTLRSAVSDYIESHNSGLTALWLEECLRYRNEHGVRDCEDGFQGSYAVNSEESESAKQLFTDMLPADYNMKYIREFQTTNVQLASIMEEGGLAGELAEIRFDLNADYIKYLNREFANGVAANLCNPMPCVFRFTEFEVKPPEGRAEEERERTEFAVGPALFQTGE